MVARTARGFFLVNSSAPARSMAPTSRSDSRVFPPMGPHTAPMAAIPDDVTKREVRRRWRPWPAGPGCVEVAVRAPLADVQRCWRSRLVFSHRPCRARMCGSHKGSAGFIGVFRWPLRTVVNGARRLGMRGVRQRPRRRRGARCGWCLGRSRLNSGRRLPFNRYTLPGAGAQDPLHRRLLSAPDPQGRDKSALPSALLRGRRAGGGSLRPPRRTRHRRGRDRRARAGSSGP
jgi:hypothetical protein